MSSSSVSSVALASPEVLVDVPCETGECPLWHAEERVLYWTDIPAGKIYRWDAASGEAVVVYEDRPVGGMTLQEDGSLVFFRDRGNVVVWRDGAVRRTVLEGIAGLEETRFNDVIADPLGGVFAGTMSWGGVHNGRLYRLAPDGSLTLISEGHGTPNGMAFSADAGTLYFTDSRKRTIIVFDFDATSGLVSRPRLWMETSAEEEARIGRSDGMTMDAAGNIWSARWEGGRVLCFSPSREVLREIELPAKCVTSVTFGGEGYQDLFITSAKGRNRAEFGPKAGSVFIVRGAGLGRAEFRSRL